MLLEGKQLHSCLHEQCSYFTTHPRCFISFHLPILSLQALRVSSSQCKVAATAPGIFLEHTEGDHSDSAGRENTPGERPLYWQPAGPTPLIWIHQGLFEIRYFGPRAHNPRVMYEALSSEPGTQQFLSEDSPVFLAFYSPSCSSQDGESDTSESNL